MIVSHVSLTNFRNYIDLDLDMPPGVCLLQGSNAQGKTNFLEAIYLLATTKSPRATTEREHINWQASLDNPPVARVAARIRRAKSELQVDITFRGQTTDSQPAHHPQGPAMPNHEIHTAFMVARSGVQKRVKINGIVRRAVDLVGQVKVVMFSPEDLDIISGSPSLRRRYLDIINCQLDPQYLRSLQRYHRVLTQRNHLLRLVRERHSMADELGFWNEQLADLGSYLIVERKQTVSAIEKLAQPIHSNLTGEKERLQLAYYPSVGQGVSTDLHPEEQLLKVAEEFKRALTRVSGKEIMLGITLVGPHRDDLRFMVNNIDMGPFGSRGQQRTISLSLRLAEANLFLARSGENPILLLDDVLSELDEWRRQHLLGVVGNYQQVIITASDFNRFEPDFLARATEFRVSEGHIEEISV